MRTSLWMCVAILALPLGAAAQDKDAKTKAAADGASKAIPLRLNLVLTRSQGEKKVSSRPYVLTAGVDEAVSSASLFAGSQVPLRTSTANGPTVVYKDVGVKVNAAVRSAGEGRFRLSIKFDDTSVVADAKGADEVLRAFAGEALVFLRDGETASFASATDPATGETVKAEVTLTLFK
jgi:hypothetical protein